MEETVKMVLYGKAWSVGKEFFNHADLVHNVPLPTIGLVACAVCLPCYKQSRLNDLLIQILNVLEEYSTGSYVKLPFWAHKQLHSSPDIPELRYSKTYEPYYRWTLQSLKEMEEKAKNGFNRLRTANRQWVESAR